jgi:hypothetical protein
MISISFSATPDIYNYKLSFYDIVDKFFNEQKEDYIPINKKKTEVVGIS